MTTRLTPRKGRKILAMEKLRAKLKKQGGFTLVEMLIVVAIIAILIAVSIPMVSSALDKAKDATDAANERGAKAEIVLMYLNQTGGMSGAGAKTLNFTNTIGTDTTASQWLCYDAARGTFEDDATNVTNYAKCSMHAATSGNEMYIWAAISKDGSNVYMAWSKAKPSAAGTSADLHSLGYATP